MNRPSILIRTAGSPLLGSLLLLSAALIVMGWTQGNFTWLAALTAVGVMLRTWTAMGRMRRYKAWAAAWDAVGTLDEPVPMPNKRRGRWLMPWGAAVLVVVIPMYLSSPSGHAALLSVLWCASIVYLLVKFVRRITARKAEHKAVAPATAPVAWLIGPASSSPSRVDAMRVLPEYSAKLLSGSGAKTRLEVHGRVSVSAG